MRPQVSEEYGRLVMESGHNASDELDASAEADQQQAETPAAAPLIELTTILNVPVASVWPTEAQHFTPWLLANSAGLSEVLGIDVELEAREHKVGRFSLDLIGREVATGNTVIIENQYGATDHGHLGQLITYAGGTRPTTIVWVAEDFREEHRAALDWLNTHTEPGLRFFGVRLKAITLKGAAPNLIAPFLELVVKPNDWEKAAAAVAAVAAAGTSPQQELYREFWSTFAPLAKARGWTNAAAPAQNWWDMPAGVTGVRWGVSFAQFGCRSEIYFGHVDADVNLARWSVLKQQEAAIVQAFGHGELIFDELPNNKGCRIETRLLGPKVTDKASWPEVVDWMVDTQERLRNAVKAAGGVPNAVTGPSAGTS
jgi:hypothetical protein